MSAQTGWCWSGEASRICSMACGFPICLSAALSITFGAIEHTMNKAIRWRLFVMMALEFAIWGCWLPLIYNYLPSLGFSTAQQAWILNTFPFAAIVGMFFSNQYADRHFSAERFLAFSHLVGGLALMGLALIKQPDA